jgi:hypothetical protein
MGLTHRVLRRMRNGRTGFRRLGCFGSSRNGLGRHPAGGRDSRSPRDACLLWAPEFQYKGTPGTGVTESRRGDEEAYVGAFRASSE